MTFNLENCSIISITNDRYAERLPVYSYWKYSLTQQIYTTSEIGKAKTITSISFYNTQNGQTRNIDIYLKSTDKTSFENDKDFISYTSADKVFSGYVTFTANQWTTIELSVPYNYTAEHNLAVIVDDNTGSMTTSTYFLAYKTDPELAISAFNDDFNIDAGNVTSAAITKTSILKNKIRINEGHVISNKTSIYLPTNPQCKYSISEQIYEASEVGGAAALSSISFYNAGDETTRNIDLYLMHVGINAFSNNSDWLTFEEEGKVFSGNVTFKKGEWTAIPFNDYFLYDGTSNLAIVVDDNTKARTYDIPEFLVYDAQKQTHALANDDIDYDSDSMEGRVANVYGFKNQIRFNEAGLNTAPQSISVTDISWDGATVSWVSRGSKWNLKYRAYGLSEWTTEEGITEKTFKLSGLEQETTYEVRVQTVAGGNAGDVSEWVSTRFVTPEHYKRPTGLLGMKLTPFSTTLRWKDNVGASSWQLSVNGDVKEAATNPFILTGLEQGTTYEIMVRSVVDAENEVYSNWSKTLNTTTPLANPVPHDFAVSTTPTTATISWQGKSDSYVVRYRPTPAEMPFFFEGFEGGLPADWTTIDADGDGYNWLTVNEIPTTYTYYSSVDISSFIPNGSNAIASASFINGIGFLSTNQYLITPQLELKGMLKFLVSSKETSDKDSYEVLLSTTGKDAADFTTVLQPMSEAPNDLGNRVFIDLSAYEGQKGYIAFHHVSTDKYFLVIDDVCLYETEPVTWETVETTGKSVTIEGLEPNTTYEYTVTGVMSREKDASSDVQSFTTMVKNPVPTDIAVNAAANTADVKWKGYSQMYVVRYREMNDHSFLEDFEGVTENGPVPNGWTTIDNDGDGYNWYGYTMDSDIQDKYGNLRFNGNGCLTSASYDNAKGALTPDNWLVTPQLDLGGVLSVWLRGQAPDYAGEHFAIYLSTTGNSVNDFTTVLLPETVAEKVLTEYVVNLSAFKGMKGYIAIRHFNVTDLFRLNVDDFSLIHADYGSWERKWTFAPEFVLTGLKPDTQYELQIVGSTDGEADATSETVYFRTASSNPIDIELDDNGSNGISISSHNGDFANVTIKNRTFKKDGSWQTICLPFKVEVENSILRGADVRTLRSVTTYEDLVVLGCTDPQPSLNAGVPYVIRWQNGGEDIVDPVFKNVTISDGTTIVGNLDIRFTAQSNYSYYKTPGDYPGFFCVTGGVLLSPILAGTELKAFDAFFQRTGTTYSDFDKFVLHTVDNDDYITGISSPEGTGDEVIYNVAGQRLSKKQPGLNIVNGQKVLVK